MGFDEEYKMIRAIIALASLLIIVPIIGAVPEASADTGQSVRTQSGKVRCYVYANDVSHGGGPLVVCQQIDGRPFPQAPISSQFGEQMNLAVVKGNGAFNWDIGNIPASDAAMANDIVLTYGQSLHINGWTILPNEDGTRFTNDATGRGMFVSIENIYAF